MEIEDIMKMADEVVTSVDGRCRDLSMVDMADMVDVSVDGS